MAGAIEYQPKVAALNSRIRSREVTIGSACLLVTIGLCLPISINIVGELFVGEILLLLVIVGQIVCRPNTFGRWPGHMKWLAISLGLSMTGYIVSDYAAGTEPHDFLRGWARIIFIAIDASGLYVLIRGSSTRLLCVAGGFSLSSVILGLIALNEKSLFQVWKFQLGYPLTLGVIAVLLLLKPSRKYLAPLCLFTFGALDVLLDCRSMGAVSILCACLQLSGVMKSARWRLVSHGVTVTVLTVGAATVAYVYVAGAGEFHTRRAESNSERLAGLIIGVREIARSPFIGHGSWAGYTDASLAAYKSGVHNRDLLKYKLTKETVGTHSQVLQLWFEGGIFGVSFGVWFGVILIKAMRAFRADGAGDLPAALLVRMLILSSTWALLLSPLASFERIQIALTIAAISVVLKSRARPVDSTSFERHLYWLRMQQFPDRSHAVGHR
jgi:hypothetical protein